MNYAIAAHSHTPCGRRYSDSTKQRRVNLLVNSVTNGRCVYFRVLSRELLGVSRKTKWSSCLDAIAVTSERIAQQDLTVSAMCSVNVLSGLPQFPISGNVNFTQPVMITLSSLSITQSEIGKKYGVVHNHRSSRSKEVVARRPRENIETNISQ